MADLEAEIQAAVVVNAIETDDEISAMQAELAAWTAEQAIFQAAIPQVIQTILAAELLEPLTTIRAELLDLRNRLSAVAVAQEKTPEQMPAELSQSTPPVLEPEALEVVEPETVEAPSNVPAPPAEKKKHRFL